jgi:TonB-dependent starch-binding outer membrane protein SusC
MLFFACCSRLPKGKPVVQTFLPMKLTAVFLLALCINVSANGFAQTVTLIERDAPLDKVFAKIEKQTGYTFVYTETLLQKASKVTLNLSNASLTQVLDACFAGQPLTYTLLNKIIVVKERETPKTLQQVMIPLVPPLDISGKVTGEKGDPLIGASVNEKGSSNTVITGADGNFRITVSGPAAVLAISYVGHEQQEITVGNRSTVTVSLKPSESKLDDVVVIGYGTRRREDVSGAVTQVTSELITKQPITSIDQGLAGLTPGVVLREGSGAPGSGPEILIRGINGFGNNKPLIVIDDIIYDNGNDQNNNPLALLNPEDIESVTILKDAATKAIYGSRATGGVILITTKRGQIGRTKITFNNNVGIASVLPFEKPDVLNASELAQFRKEKAIDDLRASTNASFAAYSDPKVPVPDTALLRFLPAAAAYLNPASFGEGTNWFDAITQKALTQNYTLSISGGNANARYYISGNYLNQEGVVINNGIKRYSFRSNLDIKLNDKLRFGLNLNPSRTEQNRPADDPGGGQFAAYGTITSTYWIDPSVPIFQPNGQYTYTTQGPLNSNWTASPVYQLNAEREVRRSTQLLAGTYLEFEPIKNLVFKTSFTWNYTQARSQNFKPSNLVGDGSLTPQFPNLDSARALLFNSSLNNIISDNTVRYRLTLGKHNFNLLGGYLVQQQTTEQSTISARSLLDENFILPDFNNVSSARLGNFTGAEEFGRFRIVSIIGRLNYDFANKYLVNFSIRRDGSSRFGRDVQYGVFPAGSVAWRVSEEGFMEKLKGTWLSELRLEAGYGLTGANVGSNYGFLGTIGNSNYTFGTSPSLYLGNTLTGLPNPLITWEESKQFDAGLNASFFRRRINLSFNVYQQITEGLHAAIPLSWITGFGSVTGNQDSRVQNRGFELQVDGVLMRRKDFTWNLGFNISQYRNKILDYYLPGGFQNGLAGNSTNVTISQAGQPVGMFRGLNVLGLYTADDIANPAVPKYTGARVGSLKYQDGNGNGVLENNFEADYVILGNPHPDLMFGWNTQVGYKGFNLRAIFAGQFGGLIYDLRREIMWNVDGNFNISRQMLDRFRPGDDPTTKEFPTTVGAPGSTTRFVRFPASNKVYDGTYMALKNLTVSYNLGRLLNSRKRMVDAAEVYIGARNVFYLAAYKYGNPEVRRSNDGSALRSINYGSYPVSRTFTAGINLTF